MSRVTTTLFFLFTFSSCGLNYDKEVDPSKNLCDEQAQCIENYTCTCSQNGIKICVKLNEISQNTVIADQNTICPVILADAGVDSADSNVNSDVNLPDSSQDATQDAISDVLTVDARDTAPDANSDVLDANITDTADINDASDVNSDVSDTNSDISDVYPDTADIIPCIPQEEICDGIDNDCDHQTDENMENCCLPNSQLECGIETGECQKGIQFCLENRTWSGCVGNTGPTDEICDNLDNNCDNQTDENFDFQNDQFNCGSCDNVCGDQNTSSSICVAGECVLICNRFFVNTDQNPNNGCECQITHGAIETCDDIDNDCDGQTDENCENLVLYLSFDEVQGNIIPDLSNFQNNAINHGATLTDDAIFGRAMSFDGVDDYAEVADSVSMDSIENEFTFFVSAKVIDFEMGDMVFSKYRLLPALGIETVAQGLRWTFFLNRQLLAQTREVNNNVWYIFSGRYRQGQFTAFINNEQIWQGNAQNSVGNNLFIGSNGAGQMSHMFIDEFSFFNKALTDEEIQYYFELLRP